MQLRESFAVWAGGEVLVFAGESTEYQKFFWRLAIHSE